MIKDNKHMEKVYANVIKSKNEEIERISRMYADNKPEVREEMISNVSKKYDYAEYMLAHSLDLVRKYDREILIFVAKYMMEVMSKHPFEYKVQKENGVYVESIVSTEVIFDGMKTGTVISVSDENPSERGPITVRDFIWQLGKLPEGYTFVLNALNGLENYANENNLKEVQLSDVPLFLENYASSNLKTFSDTFNSYEDHVMHSR